MGRMHQRGLPLICRLKKFKGKKLWTSGRKIASNTVYKSKIKYINLSNQFILI